MQASRCTPWHLRDASIFWRIWTPELNSLKDLIWELGATPSRCTYVVHLFDQLSEKALNDFVSEYLVPELSTW
jgi:hypothetical protein